MIQVAIVGAGEGGLKLIEALTGYPEVQITYVVDLNADAPGMQFAVSHGIEVRESYETFLTKHATFIDVILEVTGDPHVYTHLTQLAPVGTVVISGLALRFFMLFIEDKINLIGALESRQQELQLILNATHDGMMGINRMGVITLYNAGAERLLGVTQTDAMHKRVDDVIPNSRLEQVLTTGTAELNQVQKVNDVEIVTNRVPVYNDQGDIIGAIAIFRDVTELRYLAAEVTNLREIQTLLEAIIKSTQDAISVVDAKGHGILINPAYTRLTGLRPEDVIDKPAEVDIAEGESMHMRVLRTLQPVKNVPLKVGPSRREVLVDVAPIILNDELRGSVGVIHDVSEIKRLTEELDRANHLIRTMQAKYTFDDIVGRSPAMLIAVELAKKAAQTPATVLLRGESGTGKELFAHAIHNASDRKYKPFVRVNCASLSESLLESELFGYEEGAFTGAKRGGKRGLFEEASGGTLFLDEIGEMTVQTQAKLLRALQEQEIIRVGGTKSVPIDVRLIAATHVNLEQAIANAKFREDLYYRLNVIPIVIPPLRYRTEDIDDIATYIIFRQNQSFGRNVECLSEDAVAVLQDYDWPGNVRELENAIGRAMIHMGFNETVLNANHLPILRKFDEPNFDGQVHDLAIPSTGKLQDILRAAEQAAIERMLKETHGNKTEAARRLGISVRSLYYKIEQFQT